MIAWVSIPVSQVSLFLLFQQLPFSGAGLIAAAVLGCQEASASASQPLICAGELIDATACCRSSGHIDTAFQSAETRGLAGSMSRPSSRPSPDPEYVLRSHQAEVQALLFHPSQDLLLSGWASHAGTLASQ